MKKLLIVLIMLVTMNVNAQWVKQNSGSTNNIRDVYFLNLNTGWACGDTKIYKTTNGGSNWIIQQNPAQSYIEQIHAVDSNIVYAAGYFTILKTTNGGTNWIGIMTGTFGSGLPVFEGLYFLNANTGWICGNMKMYRTTNGGQNFDSTNINGYMTDIYFKNELEGVCSGEYTVQWTSDGGQTWILSIIKDEWRQRFDKISIINNNTGFVVGSSKITLRTTNYGITWDSVGRVISDQIIYGSKFTSVNIGYAGGTYGVLYKTTNGGQTWGFQDTNSLGNGFVKSFYGFNDSVLYAVGGGGKILHTTTGGQWLVGIHNIASEVPKGFKLHQNYPNPFNPRTVVSFSLPVAGDVSLKVYDVRGREVQTLVNERLNAGTYEAAFDGSGLTSGVYFYRMVTEGFSETKRMMLIK